MDEFGRRSRDRQVEEIARQQRAVIDSQRDRARLFGYVDDDPASRRALLVVFLFALVAILVVVLYLALEPPAVDRSVGVDEPAWGSATDESTRVQPPAWWSIEP